MYCYPIGPIAPVDATWALDEAGGDIEAPVNNALDTKIHT